MEVETPAAVAKHLMCQLMSTGLSSADSRLYSVNWHLCWKLQKVIESKVLNNALRNQAGNCNFCRAKWTWPALSQWPWVRNITPQMYQDSLFIQPDGHKCTVTRTCQEVLDVTQSVICLCSHSFASTLSLWSWQSTPDITVTSPPVHPTLLAFLFAFG